MAGTKKIPSLISNGEKYINEGLNLLLIGRHGTGKTESVRSLAEALGLKIKAYSCSTLDPFTDLVGVPVPRESADGTEKLVMIRPKDIDEANIVFFDELNRARKEVQDAVLEIINNRSINGELLPNLKCCWAAINPPGEDYNVDDLDPALMDRFDLFVEFKPRPSVAYMSQHMSEPVAKAINAWFNDHNNSKRESYISPRRLVKLGRVFEITRNEAALVQALPPGGDYDSKKLYKMLEEAADPNKKAMRDKKAINNQPNSDFEYTTAGISNKQDKIQKYLSENPLDLATHKAVAEVFESGISGSFLTTRFGGVINALTPPVLESLIQSYDQPKQSQMRTSFSELLELGSTTLGTEAKKWSNLHQAINGVTKQKGKKLPPLS